MNVYDSKKSNIKSSASLPIRRHLLVGASIGLYFGWFFRPVREPSLFVVVFLGILITLALAGLQIFRRKKENRTIASILQKLPITFVQYAIVLSILEARHFAFDFGGRFAVIVMTTIMGALAGVWMAYKGSR